MARGNFSAWLWTYLLLVYYTLYQTRASTNGYIKSEIEEEVFRKINKPEFLTGFGILNTLENYTMWASMDERLVEILSKRLEMLTTETQLIDIYLQDYQESSGKALEGFQDKNSTAEERAKFIASSALLGHRMTSRYATNVKNLRTLLNASDYKAVERDVIKILQIDTSAENSTQPGSNDSSHFEPDTWIGRKEMFMSMQGFLHIQEIHEYLPEQLKYELEDQEMTIQHCVEIAMFALYRKKYHNSVQWLEHARNLTKEYGVNNQKNWIDVIDSSLLLVTQEHNRARKKLAKDWDPQIILNVFQRPVVEFDNRYERITKRSQLLMKYSGLGNKTAPEAQLMDLCRGNVAQTAEMQRTLRCYYEKTRHPYLYINPVKVEHLSESPPIIQFYDVIGSKRTERFKRNCRPELRPLGTVGGKGTDDFSQWKTSVVMSLPNNGTDTERISVLSEILAGMKSQLMEPIQYAEYSVGKFNGFHKDSFGNSSETMNNVMAYGDRLATMLFYLEEPEKGGETGFCDAGVSVKPQKGSAVFWYGLYRNGTLRDDVVHGSCPLLRGHKISSFNTLDSLSCQLEYPQMFTKSKRVEVCDP